MRIAYIKDHIDWDREGIFDKYFIRAFLERGDVDVYANVVPETISSYFKAKGLGKLRIKKFRSFGPTALTYIHVWAKLRLLEKQYDLLVTDSSFYNVANALLDSPKSIIYFQTPERGFYDLYDYRILTKRNPFRRLLQHLWARQRVIDNIIVRRSKNSLIFGNSNNVARRIYKTYLKRAVVVHPAPAVRDGFKAKTVPSLHGKRFFFTVNRIIPEKRIEIMIEAFRHLPKETLVIAGWFSTGRYEQELKRLAQGHSNILFLDRTTEAETLWLYRNCEAVLQTALDEDFGMVPCEAMVEGKPVIAVAEGGFCETVIPFRTGVLIHEPYEENLIKAIKAFRPTDFRRKDILAFVHDNFVYERFSEKLWDAIDKHRRRRR